MTANADVLQKSTAERKACATSMIEKLIEKLNASPHCTVTRSKLLGNRDLKPLVSILSKYSGTITKLVETPSASNISSMETDFLEWEKENFPYKLPNDLKKLLTISNGFSLQWSIPDPSVVTVTSKPNENERKLQESIRGEIQIRSLREIFQVPYKDVIDSDTESEDDSNSHLLQLQNSSHQKPVCFVLDSSGPMVVLLYTSTGKDYKTVGKNYTAADPQIWFQDYSQQWHFIASNTTAYFRLMLLHLGIKNWQFKYATSNVYLPNETKFWMELLIPGMLFTSKNEHENCSLQDEED